MKSYRERVPRPQDKAGFPQVVFGFDYRLLLIQPVILRALHAHAD